MEGSSEPPGTVFLENGLNGQNGLDTYTDGQIVLIPQPSNDPNEPLNWPKWQKALIFGIANMFTLMVYATLDVSTVTWPCLTKEFGFSDSELTTSYAVSFAGLAVGCIFFIPVAISVGRKPVFLFASLAMVLVNVGQAMFKTKAQYMVLQVLAGLAGSINDTIVQMTIVDLFFVHQRATMAGIYSFTVVVGVYLSLIPTGYVIQSEGWRWVWWWCAILNGLVFVSIIFLFEETRYARSTGNCFFGEETHEMSAAEHSKLDIVDAPKNDEAMRSPLHKASVTGRPEEITLQRKTYIQRMTSLGPAPDWGIRTYLRYLKRPFILFFRIPAVAFVAIQYSFILCWVAALATTQPILFSAPPYKFSSVGVGNVNISPFVGALVGSIYGGPLNDYYVVLMAQRRGGIYDPELRLHMLLAPLFITPLGLFLYGISISQGMPWIVPVVGSGLAGFGVGSVMSIIFPYVEDSYRELVAEAVVVVTCTRNGIATAAAFAVSPWLHGMGVQNMFITAGCLCFVILVLMVPMTIWGRKARSYTAGFYTGMVASN